MFNFVNNFFKKTPQLQEFQPYERLNLDPNRITNCPYCNFQFPKPPKRSAQCSSCSNKYYVLRGVAITERDKLISDLLFYLEGLGATKEIISNYLDKAPKKSFNDHQYALLNRLIFDQKSSRIPNSQTISICYTRMASILESEGKKSAAKQTMKTAEEYFNTDLKQQFSKWN